MTLDDVLSNIADQDRGAELVILDPWKFQPTGIVFRIAGPDSEVQRRARLAHADELDELAGLDGKVTREQLETARLNLLARCVLSMTIEENGKPVALTQTNIVRVLRAGLWIQAQVDVFAGSRENFPLEGK